jgi:hypothetical protein
LGRRITPPPAALDLGQAEARVFGGDDQVAAERQLEAAAHGPALDGRDQRLRQRGLGQPAEPAARDLRGLTGQRGLEVHAGAERAVGAGEDAGPQFGVGLQGVQCFRQSGRDRRVHGVAGLRPVDRDQQGPADPLGAHFGAHDFTSLLSQDL